MLVEFREPESFPESPITLFHVRLYFEEVTAIELPDVRTAVWQFLPGLACSRFQPNPKAFSGFDRSSCRCSSGWCSHDTVPVVSIVVPFFGLTKSHIKDPIK